MFNHLIVDPGDMKWEQTCPGALYVSLSRAKTMGTFTSDTSFPRDSAIYWVGCGISSTRIKEGHLRKNKKKGGPKLKCTLIEKRDHWIKYLQKKRQETKQEIFSDLEKQNMRKVKYTQVQVRERIVDMIITPNESWAKQKRGDKYSIPRNYFGQHA